MGEDRAASTGKPAGASPQRRPIDFERDRARAEKREMRRRAAIEPLIGHAKSGHRMGRNHLAGQAGDAITALLAAAGYNFRRLLAWFRLLLSELWMALAVLCRSGPANQAT